MTDFFLLLMLAGAGDELQGMKRGIIEMLDGMAINKADGDNKAKAERARIEYANALHLFPAPADGWTPPVVTCSSRTGDGIAAVWQMVLDQRQLLEGNGFLAQQRSRQALEWMNELVMLGLENRSRPTGGMRPVTASAGRGPARSGDPVCSEQRITANFSCRAGWKAETLGLWAQPTRRSAGHME